MAQGERGNRSYLRDRLKKHVTRHLNQNLKQKTLLWWGMQELLWRDTKFIVGGGKCKIYYGGGEKNARFILGDDYLFGPGLSAWAEFILISGPAAARQFGLTVRSKYQDRTRMH
jgi:hypothetical protein